jgi:hypothetical protein
MEFNIFLICLLVAVAISFVVVVVISNRKNQRAVQNFLDLAAPSEPLIIPSIPIRYVTTNGDKGQVSIDNSCDLYLFSNCLAIVRKQNFVFPFQFSPIILTADVAKTRETFADVACYKPTKVKANGAFKGRVNIIIQHPAFKRWKIDITLKSLTDEQVNSIVSLTAWY